MKRLLTTIVVGLAGVQGFHSLAADSRPKLVVGIVVDQLRTDYLENLKDMLGPGGFRRLMESGVYLKDIDTGVVPGDAASASAIIMTGEYPRYNGVTGEIIFDASSKSLLPIFKDEAFIGNFTDETYSPAALRVTTLSDEITIENNGKNQIHSIAPDAAQAIVLAGHTGNSAFWLNDESGRWASTTYYQNPPSPLQLKNYNNPVISTLDTLKWTPLRKQEPYPDVSAEEIKNGFKYSFSRSDRDVFSFYKTSPFVNSDIAEAAVEYISTLNLGKNDEITDVLNLGFTLAPFANRGKDEYRFELEDSYLRLDKDLEKIFNTLDKNVGKDNVLVYLVSTGYFEQPVVEPFKYRLPGGTFSVKRALSLLNAYLSAKYGNGAYVDQYAGGQIYLSKAVLEEKNLEFYKVAEEARDFLMKMSGVAEAFTASDLASPSLPQLEELRLAIDPKSSGDIILDFNPGWKVIDDSRYPPEVQPMKSTVYQAPGFIMGPNIKAQVIELPVSATAIAPTIAKTLRIRAPNSASDKPLSIK